MSLNKLFSFQCRLFFLLLLFYSTTALGQLGITGPDCVLTRLTYQYNIEGERKINDKIKVCVEGGVIAETSISCLENENLSSVRVKWSERTSTGKITLTSLAGTSTINVNIATAFRPGIIETTDRQVINYNNLSPSLSCTQASGGTCS